MRRLRKSSADRRKCGSAIATYATNRPRSAAFVFPSKDFLTPCPLLSPSLPHCPMGFWTGTSVETPPWVAAKVVGALEGMMYQVPFEGRQMAMSVFPSPS